MATSLPTSQAAQILDEMRSQAQALLGTALGTGKLDSFAIGSLGNFPYYIQNPRDLKFNSNTYQWINTNLRAATRPLEQDQTFTNIYLQAISSIAFTLSTADQNALSQAQQNATDQQAALLTAWQSAFGSLPPATPTQQPIDIIMTTIATQWASPPTNLRAIQTSKNLFQLLNNTPASGQPVVSALAKYLNALGGAISLQNATTMNTGYLQTVVQAVQSPSTSNGAMVTDDGTLHPAYVVSTQLSDILNGLQASGNAVTLNMSVSRSSESELTVSVSGKTGFRIPVGDFFSINLGGSASYFQDNIAKSSNEISMSMSYPGVTLVSFGPVAFDPSTNLNWYWMFPITEAIANGDKDVTGFHFKPKPNIDFSASGPFGYITAAAIATYPTVTLTVSGSNYKSIQQDFQANASARLSFLGIPLASGSASVYSGSTSVDDSKQKITITLKPPAQIVSGSSTASTAWILGVQSLYPAAS